MHTETPEQYIDNICFMLAAVFNLALLAGVLGIVIRVTELLFGGRLIISIVPVIWVCFGLAGRNMVKNARIEKRFRVFDLLMVNLFMAADFFVRLSLLVSLLLCTVLAVFGVLAYKAHIRHLEKLAG